MAIRKIVVLFLSIIIVMSFTIFNNVYAETAVCNIDIEDGNGTHYKITESYKSHNGAAGNKRAFKLPGSKIECTLVFFDLNTGTSLSCDFDEIGQNYIQSDRTLLNEKTINNNLTFRYKSKLFTIKTHCKEK